MANVKTRALSKEQYQKIMETLQNGATTGDGDLRPNRRVQTILAIEAVLGLRISDILLLTDDSFEWDNGLERYRLDIKEQKTGKPRTFTVSTTIFNYIRHYCKDEHIGSNERIFAPSPKKRKIIPKNDEERQRIIKSEERGVQKILKKVCDYLGYDGISTHSFRKFFATNIYNASDGNIAEVQKVLQHASPVTTSRYIGVDNKKTEEDLKAQEVYLPTGV